MKQFDNLNLNTIKHFCSVKDTLKGIKREVTNKKKILAKDNFIYIYHIKYKDNSSKLINKMYYLIKNLIKDLNRFLQNKIYRWLTRLRKMLHIISYQGNAH